MFVFCGVCGFCVVGNGRDVFFLYAEENKPPCFDGFDGSGVCVWCQMVLVAERRLGPWLRVVVDDVVRVVVISASSSLLSACCVVIVGTVGFVSAL